MVVANHRKGPKWPSAWGMSFRIRRGRYRWSYVVMHEAIFSSIIRLATSDVSNRSCLFRQTCLSQSSIVTGGTRGQSGHAPPPWIRLCHCSMASLPQTPYFICRETLSVGMSPDRLVAHAPPRTPPGSFIQRSSPDPVTGGGINLVMVALCNTADRQ